jgi:hypothetical protein
MLQTPLQILNRGHNGNGNGGNGHKRPYRKSGRHFRDGMRAAALRAFTAACINLGLPIPKQTEAVAAAQAGSSLSYAVAMVAIVKVGDEVLLAEVLNGKKGILEAGQEARARLQFVNGFHAMGPGARKAAAQDVGVAEIWDTLILPAIDE